MYVFIILVQQYLSCTFTLNSLLISLFLVSQVMNLFQLVRVPSLWASPFQDHECRMELEGLRWGAVNLLIPSTNLVRNANRCSLWDYSSEYQVLLMLCKGKRIFLCKSSHILLYNHFVTLYIWFIFKEVLKFVSSCVFICRCLYLFFLLFKP